MALWPGDVVSSGFPLILARLIFSFAASFLSSVIFQFLFFSFATSFFVLLPLFIWSEQGANIIPRTSAPLHFFPTPASNLVRSLRLYLLHAQVISIFISSSSSRVKNQSRVAEQTPNVLSRFVECSVQEGFWGSHGGRTPRRGEAMAIPSTHIRAIQTSRQPTVIPTSA
ncbi:hypothetical protein SEVIR_4G103300v4 [Setaria viridis]|uniref:Uncharacterized protein n=1 Tax=Setaria viridis TaxID=4556 RepID=A0A4U6UXM0_SETVI|nr:hypothetical protein SEVIR_4G103300v2 [Setaria viridis]